MSFTGIGLFSTWTLTALDYRPSADEDTPPAGLLGE
jgi:hypothetical protein